MEISKSIFGLAKSNNGFFKSEKQLSFLIGQLERFDGLIGQASSGYNSCPIFANWDNEGITKIVKSSKSGDVVMFERKVDGFLTSLEIKEIKSIERKIKTLEKEISERQVSFDNGTYNSTGDITTYKDDMVERFNRFQSEKKVQLKNLKDKVK
jgi:hypothetical protein